MGKDTKAPVGPSLSQLWTEIKAFQQQLKDMREIVNKLKDVLLTKDNWHSKIVKWLDKDVVFCVNPAEPARGTMGKLLWTDRYHIGVAVVDPKDPNIVREHLVNKGHIVSIREA
jgi:hypothetical protein